MGEKLLSDFEQIQKSLDVLDNKILKYNESVKDNLTDDVVDQIKAFQTERKEIEKEFDDLVNQINRYGKIDEFFKSNQKEKGSFQI